MKYFNRLMWCVAITRLTFDEVVQSDRSVIIITVPSLNLTPYVEHGFSSFMRIFLCVVFSILFFQTNVWAMSYSGVFILSDDKKLRLKDDSSGKSYELESDSSEVKKVLKKLKVDDYVSFDGARSATVTTIRVDSINFVGLHDLLGAWKGDDHYCYNFINFTEFSIYPKEDFKCLTTAKSSRKFSYTVNPTEDGDWVILLSDDQSNYAADLSLKTSNSIQIQLYDSDTGYILKVIRLKK